MSLYVQRSPERPDASVVLLLHGVGASGWMWWRQTAALTDFHCLNVDLPGHGQSNREAWTSLADTADQVAALMRTLETQGRVHVVGLSLGGYVALTLLERHADAVERAVIGGVTAAPMPNKAWLQPQIWLMSNVLKRRWVARSRERAGAAR